MPLPVESLTPDSPVSAVRDAISASIEKCMQEGGRTQKECAAMVYEMTRDTGARIPEDRG